MAKGKLTPQKRQKIEKLVLDVVRAMDNSKMDNYKRYEALFRVMGDESFEEWANGMGHDLDDTIQMYQLPFEEMKMTQIKKAADILKVPLEEYIWFRHNDQDGIRTKMRVPVGFIHIKRVQQLLAKKNKYALDNEKVGLKSGQVKDESKVTSVSDPETFALTAINAEAALKEFLGPRADNQSKKLQMYRSIARDGYSTLEDMPEDITQSTTLNTMNTYLVASGIRSDLVGNTLKTNYTIDIQLKQRIKE
jgi:hypothetical protein